MIAVLGGFGVIRWWGLVCGPGGVLAVVRGPVRGWSETGLGHSGPGMFHMPCPDKSDRVPCVFSDGQERRKMVKDGHADPFEDLLAGQSEESLTRMLNTFAEQESEARVKARLVKRAIERRASAGQPARSGDTPAREDAPERGGGGRYAGVSRETLVGAVREAGRPVSPAALCEILVERGHTANHDSVRKALRRAVERGELERLDDRSYVAAGDRPGPAENETRGEGPRAG